MALAVAQSVHFTGVVAPPSTSSAFAGATTVGNLIVVILNGYNGTPISSTITDSKSNTYHLDFQYVNGLLTQTYYSAQITTGGTGHTVTCGGAEITGICNMDIVEVSGAATSTPFDKSSSNSATSATPYTTGSTGTLSQADEIVLVSVGIDTGNFFDITEDATYTLIGEFLNGTGGFVSNSAYKIVSATTAINHTWTSTFPSDLWFATAATYKAAAGVPNLVVANGAHAHTADSLTLSIPGVFTVQDAAHAHTGDQVPFPPQALAANASHGHTADNITLPAAALASDDFNRANGALGSAWVFGGTNFTIVSNHAHCASADFAVFNTALPSADHYVEADILTGDATYTVIHGRTTPALRGNTCYEAFMVPTGGSGGSTRTVMIGKTVGGAYSDIASASFPTPTLTNFRLRLEMVGTALRAYVDGVLRLSTTDSSITTGNYAGINAQTNGDYDNWAAGAVGTNLAFDSGAHAHTADNVVLSTGFIVNSGAHAHTADNILLPATLTVANAAHAHVATTLTIARFLYPVSVSNRKLIDQTGGVFILNDFSSWAMANNLTNAEITQALEGVSARHFSCVNVGLGVDAQGPPAWHKYTNAAGQPFFATTAGGTTPGTPFRDPLGAAWSSMDWIVSECTRLGLTLMYSVFGGYNTANGITGELNACTVAECYTFGQRLWNRYAASPNIIWHLEWEGMWGPTSSEGQRADAIFHAISDGHVGAGRPGSPLIFAEQIANDTNAGAFIGTGWTWMLVTASSLYQYVSNSTEVVDNAYNQVGITTYPVWDCEPSYIGSTAYNSGAGSYAPLTDQISRQNWRERNYAILIRGGIGINFGDEAWWTFGAPGLYNVPWTWQDVPTNVTSFEAQYCWDLLITPQVVQDPTWVPDNSFLVTGLGSGDTKAACGRGAHTAVAYFPNNSRTVAVDTTKVGGTATSYLTPSVSVAQTADNAAFFPTDFTIVAKVRKPAFGAVQTIASQAATTGVDVGWRFGFNAGGALIYDYSTTGTSLNGSMGTLSGSLWSSVATGTPIYVAFSLDQNPGVNQTYGGWWSLDGVTWNGPSGGGTTGSAPPAYFNSTSNIRIGAHSSANADMFGNGIDWVEVRTLGTGPTTGTVIWRFDAADWASGTSWTDARGHVWLIGTSAAITDVPATPVRLRWYDPVLATFTNIAVGEAPTTSRSVSFPGGVHSDNNTDWALVIDDRTDLGVNNGNHAHTADNVVLVVLFSVSDGNHGHIATTVTLSTGLVVADALHAHTADQVPVSTGLAIANSAHAHTADNVVLGVGITVADGLHGHRADNVDVAPAGVVNSAFHAHIATNIVLTVVAISKIRLGSTIPQSMKVGNAPVTRVYLGNNQVF